MGSLTDDRVMASRRTDMKWIRNESHTLAGKDSRRSVMAPTTTTVARRTRSNTRRCRRRRANYGRPNVSKPDYFAALIYLLNNHFASAAKSPSAPVSVMIKFGIGRHRRVRYSVVYSDEAGVFSTAPYFMSATGSDQYSALRFHWDLGPDWPTNCKRGTKQRTTPMPIQRWQHTRWRQ